VFDSVFIILDNHYVKIYHVWAEGQPGAVTPEGFLHVFWTIPVLLSSCM
jgi:hypothetical protein